MTTKESFDITKAYTKNGFKFKPEIKSGYYFYFKCGEIYLSNIELNHFALQKLSLKQFNKLTYNINNTKFFELNERFNFNHPFLDFSQDVFEIIGFYAFTSVGLISEEAFYLAEDIKEQQRVIKNNSLEIGIIYESNTGKEYIYIGEIRITSGEEEIHNFGKTLYDISAGKTRNLGAVRLINEIGKNEKSYLIDITNDFPNLRRSLRYNKNFQPIAEDKNINFELIQT